MPSESETSRFASQQIAILLDRLESQVRATAESQGQGEVHDLRVAIRRLTQALSAFKQRFPRQTVQEVRAAVKALMKAAGPVRDIDIALKFLLKCKDKHATELRRNLRANRNGLAAALKSVSRKGEARTALPKWRAALPAAYAQQSRRGGTVDEARRRLGGVAKQFFKAGKRAAKSRAPVADIHAFRIKAKKFRYTLELFQPVFGHAAAQWLKRLKALQTLLGDINDCRVIRELVAGVDGSAGIVKELKKRQRKKTRKFRGLWEADYRATGRRRWVHELRG